MSLGNGTGTNVVITSDSITFKVPEGAISYSGQYTLKVKFDAGVASCNVSLTALYDDKDDDATDCAVRMYDILSPVSSYST